MKKAVMAAVLCAAAPTAYADDTTLTFGGYAKLDTIVSRFSEGPVAADVFRDFYVPAGIPVGDGESSTYTDMHAKESRLYFKVDSTVEGHKVGAYFEMDFIVNPGSADERITNAYNPGLRRAFVTFDNWTAGQDWSTFQNLTALPENLDFVSWPSDATPFMRQALVRYTGGPLEVSLENPETTITLADGTRVEADQNTLPDLVARYKFAPGASQFSLAGIVRQLRSDGAGGVSDSVMGYGASLAGKVPLGASNDIRFTVSGGKGISRYLALNAVNDVMIDTDGDFKTIGTYAGFVAFRHMWTPKLRSSFTISAFEADHDVDLVGTGVTKSMRNGSVNLLYSPIEPLTVGIEYRHATRKNEAGDDGDLDRIQMSAKYLFKWTR